MTRLLDATLDVAVASFAVWTVVHALALAGLPLGVGLGVWVAGTPVLVWWRSRGRWLAATPDPAPGPALVGLAACVGAAVLSAVVVRADLDDAFYMVRATWTADHGAVPTGDFLFTEGLWPAVYYPGPDFSSLDALHGALAWASGAAAGSVAYRWFVPVAAFGAVWALWRLLRTWQARRPAAGLLLAGVMLLWGGYAHASFGNMSVARIWQGKVVFVALLVPYLWTALVSVWAPDRRQVRSALVVVAVASTAGVGLTQTAVFVVPLVAVAGAGVLLVRREVVAAVVLVVAASVVPVASGLAVVFSAGEPGGFERNLLTPWTVVVANLAVGAVVVGAGLAVGAGARWPAVAVLARGQRALAVAVLVAAVFTVPPLFTAVEKVIGGDSISWRVAWVLPVPALVGLLASLPVPRLGWLPAFGVAVVLVVAGLPLWSPANGAYIAPGAWKVRDPVDLEVAQWVVDQRPGTFLAANYLVATVGILSSAPRPVASRPEWTAQLGGLDDARADQRALLQQFADSPDRSAEVLDEARAALDDLDVTVACVAWADDLSRELFETSGFVPGLSAGPWTCWTR